ncbi:transposable element Tcb1 transposase [Trichonephila clavipes]|nr:transposable element Tcb1 transposase [Trichonephila clavipes]
MVWGMFPWDSGSLIIVEGTMDQYKCASVFADHVHPYMRIVFPHDDRFHQQDNVKCHTTDSDHLDLVVHSMDPHLRNLGQLAMALKAWLNIPVNTFGNLIGSLPPLLTAVCSAKSSYSGF